MNTDAHAGVEAIPAPTLTQLIESATAIENDIAVLQARLALVKLEIERARSSAEIEKPQAAALRAELDVTEAIVAPCSERLTLIRGIDPDTASMLNGLGITAFTDIAALTPEDVHELERMLDAKRRISSQCWIEQAAMLARGEITSFAARQLRGEFDTIAKAPSDAERSPFDAGDAAVALAVAAAEAAVARLRAAAAPAPVAVVLAPVAPVPAVASEPSIELAAKPCNVTMLEAERDRRKASAPRRPASAGRWAALTASILIVLGIALGGSDFAGLVMDQIGLTGCHAQGAAAGNCGHLAHVAL